MRCIHLTKTCLPPQRDSYDSGDEGRAGVLDPSSSDLQGGYGAEDDVLTHEPSQYLSYTEDRSEVYEIILVH